MILSALMGTQTHGSQQRPSAPNFMVSGLFAQHIAQSQLILLPERDVLQLREEIVLGYDSGSSP